MASQVFDVNDEARGALRVVVSDYGIAALSSPQVLGSLLKDLLPDLPRESSILLAAADADIATLLKDRMTQHVATPAAIAQAARQLEERTALSPEACHWAARQLAEVIGLPAPYSDPAPAPDTANQANQATQTAPARDSQYTPQQEPPPPAPPRPVPPRPAPAGRAAARTADLAALLCALTIPLQLTLPSGIDMPYGWEPAPDGRAPAFGAGARRCPAGWISRSGSRRL